MADKVGLYGLLGLVSTAFAAALNLAGFTVAALWLDEAVLVEFRLVLNTAIIAGTLACLGWDSAAVRLGPAARGRLDGTAFGLLGLMALLLAGLVWVLGGPQAGPVPTYGLGVAIGCVFAYGIVHFNIARADGRYWTYFLGLNIADKAWRTLAIITAAVLAGALLYPVLFAGLVVWAVGLRVRAVQLNRAHKSPTRPSQMLAQSARDIGRFAARPNGYLNVSFFVSSAFVFYLTRAAYFLTPTSQAQALIAIDLAMMIGAFFFVPVQSVLKIHEAERYRGGGNLFAQARIPALWRLFALETAMVLGAVLVLVVYDRTVLGGGLQMPTALALLAAMVIASSLPNMVQIAIHEGDGRIWPELAVYCALSLGIYLGARVLGMDLTWAFVAVACLYLVWGVRLARRAGLEQFLIQRVVRTGMLCMLIVASGAFLERLP